MSDLKNRGKYRLSTPTTSNDLTSVLGDIDITLILVDENSQQHYVTLPAIIVKTPLTSVLIHWAFLKKSRFQFVYKGDVEYLSLTLPCLSDNSRSQPALFPTEERKVMDQRELRTQPVTSCKAAN